MNQSSRTIVGCMHSLTPEYNWHYREYYFNFPSEASQANVQ